MGQKKQIFLQLYTKDYTGDERLRMCSPAAWGVYSYLLCLMNSSATRGAYKLSDLERRPELKRSLTQRALTAASDDKRIAPFAEILQRQMPWKKTEILRALKELLFYRVVVIEEDALIQPRMYRESGNRLTADEQTKDLQEDEEDTEEEVSNEGENNGAENGTKKGTDKSTKKDYKKDEKNSTPARAIARAPYENMSYENNNNDNNINDKNKLDKCKDEKTAQKKKRGFTPPMLDEVKEYFKERKTDIDPEAFFAHYEANGWMQSRGKPIKNWKACLTTWEKRREEFAASRHSGSRGATRIINNYNPEKEDW